MLNIYLTTHSKNKTTVKNLILGLILVKLRYSV